MCLSVRRSGDVSAALHPKTKAVIDNNLNIQMVSTRRTKQTLLCYIYLVMS